MKMLKLEAVQWSNLKDIDDIEPLSDKDYEVLKEVGDVLRKHGLTDRFGVCLLHKHFDVADDEILFEKTDFDARISTLSPQKLPPERKNNAIGTMWRYSDGPQAVTVCEEYCDKNFGHPRKHKKVGR